MARDTRVTRQPAGPGRPARRTPRGAGRPASPDSAGTPASAREVRAPAPTAPPRIATGLSRITQRAVVLVAVVVVLGLSYVGVLRAYLIQGTQLAEAEEQITQRTVRVAQVEVELARWRDPAYVKAQARSRLGWVMPGEVGYRVIGRDGTVLSGDQEIEGVGTSSANELEPRWWEHLAGSLKAADDPAPVEPGR